MSGRATTPEGRGKRSHSFGADSSSAEKRSRREDDSARRDLSRQDAGPSTMASSSSHRRQARSSDSTSLHSGSIQLKPRYSSPTMSDPISSPSADSSDTRRGSHSRQPNEPSTSLHARPTWQTEPSEQSEPEWSVREERDRDPDSREPRDQELRATSTNPSRGLTPPASGSGLLQAQPPRTQAAFVNKLYSMLEDNKIADSRLLYWSTDGTSFVCPNPTEFSKEVLPNYFKHNNWQSFVRQLNMYSFNKVSDLYSTANSDPQAWEFRHSKFLRGRPDLLPLIKRKAARPIHPDPPSVTDSPGDDQERVIGGWTSGLLSHHAGASQRFASPPPRDHRDYRPPYYHPHTRPVSSGYEVTRTPPRAIVPQGAGGRPLSHSGYPTESSQSEPPYYPHSQPPPSRLQAGSVADVTLIAQVVSLQENVSRLWSTMQHERYDSASRHLDMTNQMIRMTDWVGESSKVRYPVEVLHRQRMELITRLEVLQSQSPDLFIAGPSTSHDDRRLGSSSYDEPPIATSSMQHSSMYESRQIHTSHHEPPSHVPDRVRPATSAEPSHHHYSGSPRTYPAHSHPHPHFHRSQPPPGDFRYGLSSDERAVREHRRRASSSQRRDLSDTEDKAGAIDFDSKTSLRNLLH